VFIVAAFFMTRDLLILTGVLKGPVLQKFEKYGDQEDFYYVLPSLIMWIGWFCITSSFWLASFLPSVTPLIFFGGMFLVAAGGLHYYRDTLHHTLVYFPRWQYDIISRTKRQERRRLAYMWLHLPPRLRLIYNGNHRAFREWADFVILATFH